MASDKQRDQYYRRTYGVTLEWYNKQLKDQNYSCALCKKEQSVFKKRLAVEHNHKTGHVRALCCFQCNKFKIGRNNLESAKALYDYMKKYDG